MDSIFDLIFEFASAYNLSQCEDSISKMKDYAEDISNKCRPQGHEMRLSGSQAYLCPRDRFWDYEMYQKHDFIANIGRFAEDASHCIV